MTETPSEPHPMFEVFSDASYYDMWCLRRKGSQSFDETIHFMNAKQAIYASHVIAHWVEVEKP